MKRPLTWMVVAAVVLTWSAPSLRAEESAEAPRLSFFGHTCDCLPFLKLGRGLSNVALGWMEIPINVDKGYHEPDQAAGFFGGLVLGVAKTFGRMAIGVYETATFWLPSPEHYRPILPTLEYFQKGHEPLPLE